MQSFYHRRPRAEPGWGSSKRRLSDKPMLFKRSRDHQYLSLLRTPSTLSYNDLRRLERLGP